MSIYICICERNRGLPKIENTLCVVISKTAITKWLAYKGDAERKRKRHDNNKILSLDNQKCEATDNKGISIANRINNNNNNNNSNKWPFVNFFLYSKKCMKYMHIHIAYIIFLVFFFLSLSTSSPFLILKSLSVSLLVSPAH